MKRGLVTLIMIAWIFIVIFVGVMVVLGVKSASTLIKEETLSVQDINSIILHNDRKSVEILATESAQARIRQYGRAGTATGNLFTVDIANGSATINSKSRLEIFDFWISYERIVIEIPSSWIGNVELNSKSGGISIKDSFVWKDVKMNCTSGGVDIARAITADNIVISVSSGGIRTDSELTASGTIKAESTSGGIRFNMPIKASEVYIKASSGTVALDKTNTSNLEILNTSGGIKLGETKTKNFAIENSSGGINVAGITGSGSMKTTSGGIRVKLNDPVGVVNLEAKSGSIRITVDASLSFTFSGQCTSGSVRSNFPLDGSGNSASATVGNNPTAIITATATSGGIKINQE